MSFCGDEETETPPEELYSPEDAEAALREAALAVETRTRFFGS